MLVRITVQVPREVKESLRKECFEKRTSYREIVSKLIADHYGLRLEEMKEEVKNTN